MKSSGLQPEGGCALGSQASFHSLLLMDLGEETDGGESDGGGGGILLWLVTQTMAPSPSSVVAVEHT